MKSRYSIIDFNALQHNFLIVKKFVGPKLVMPIIKANAYGHGLVECAQFYEQSGADFLGVAFIEEAIQLRNGGITKRILVLGASISDQIPLFLNHTIDITVASIEKLQEIDACARQHGKKARVHLKIDTGLGRIGVRAANAEKFFIETLRSKFIEIVGVFSHFATADKQDSSFMHEQYEKFHEASLFFEKNSLKMPIRHMANSGAIMQFPESHLDMVRPGIMLYGIYPQSWMRSLCQLKPVLSLYARVVYFKVLLKNSGISYDLTWKADSNTRIITLPIGYGDGYPRALSNKGHVLLNGFKHPIVGNICMDQMMVNIGSAQAYNGDQVVLIGKSGNQEITINDLADSSGGSPYEILVSLNGRIPRYYVYPDNLKSQNLKT
ncbi:MAG: alanine racemase [Candidatus Babeliaceae bacterium]|nr:alanine racemase [Candidatus Babeliaceae bacterium]